MSLGSLNIYIEVLTFIIGIVGVYYIFDSLHRLGDKLFRAWNLFFMAFIVFIFAEIFRIVSAYTVIPNEETYKIAFRFVTTFLIVLALVKFNTCVRGACIKKRSRKR